MTPATEIGNAASQVVLADQDAIVRAGDFWATRRGRIAEVRQRHRLSSPGLPPRTHSARKMQRTLDMSNFETRALV